MALLLPSSQQSTIDNAAAVQQRRGCKTKKGLQIEEFQRTFTNVETL